MSEELKAALTRYGRLQHEAGMVDGGEGGNDWGPTIADIAAAESAVLAIFEAREKSYKEMVDGCEAAILATRAQRDKAEDRTFVLEAREVNRKELAEALQKARQFIIDVMSNAGLADAMLMHIGITVALAHYAEVK